MNVRQGKSKILKTYDTAIKLAETGEDVVVYIEVLGSMRKEPLVMVSKEVHTGKIVEVAK